MKKIGVYDSGMGGLTLLAKLIRDLPGYEYVYFGDSANAPYGVRPREEIIDLARAATERLIEEGCEALVIACNTASSAAEDVLKREYSLPIFGMEPALNLAVESKLEGSLLVMATEFTLQNPRYLDVVESLKGKREIISLPSPSLVLLVEQGITSGEPIRRELEKTSRDLDLTDLGAIVLGCTHFLFIKEEIRRFFGEAIEIFDSHSQTVDLIRNRLGEASGESHYSFTSSGGSEIEEKFRWMMEKYLQQLV